MSDELRTQTTELGTRGLRFVLILLLVSATFSLRAAPNPTIENLAATAANAKVSVRFSLTGAFANGEMVEGLQSGVPTSFTYIVEIFRDRPNWFDDGIARARIEVICTFNSVTREYLLNYRRDDRLVRSETFPDLAGLERGMTSVEEQDLFDITGRKPYKLKVRVKANLMRGWVMYVIPWDVSTRWRETRVVEQKLAVGEKQLAVGSWQLAGGHRPVTHVVVEQKLAVGEKQSAVGSRQSAVGPRPTTSFVVNPPPTANRQPPTRYRP